MSGGGSADSPPRPRPVENFSAHTGSDEDDGADARTLGNTNPFEDGQSVSVSVNSHAPLIVGAPGGPSSSAVGAPSRVPSLLSLTSPMVVALVNYPAKLGLPVRKLGMLLECAICTVKLMVLRLAVLGIYLIIWLFSGLYRNNPFVTPYRAGIVGISQVPLVLFCVMKNNPVQYLTGVAYEKVSTATFLNDQTVTKIQIRSLTTFTASPAGSS
jgi:hypothetical protein